MLPDLVSEIRKYADSKRAKNFAWFFKTGPGEYGEGDKFLGLNTPQMRSISKKYQNLSLPEVQELIKSPYHEERSIAIQILVHQFPQNPKTIYNFYLKNTKYINNWDLVDISAGHIVGGYLMNRPRVILDKLARSKSLWERRIAIISTLAFIVKGQSEDALRISKLLLSDKHDLIHKAVGWMLREVDKRCNEETLIKFLQDNYPRLPRTTLRYAIERFSKEKRKQYLQGKF